MFASARRRDKFAAIALGAKFGSLPMHIIQQHNHSVSVLSCESAQEQELLDAISWCENKFGPPENISANFAEPQTWGYRRLRPVPSPANALGQLHRVPAMSWKVEIVFADAFMASQFERANACR